MAVRYVDPVPQYLDDAGNPLAYGKLYFYATGTNTELDTFADINLSIPNTNPVVLSASGRLPNVYLKSATYKVKITDNDESQIWERDPVGAESAEGSFSVWNSLTLYNSNEIVEGADGNFYISITEDNQGNDPTSSPANWTQIKFNRVWNSNETYKNHAIVQGSDGFIYVSKAGDNLNNNPVTDSVNWQVSSNLDVPAVVLSASKTYAYNNF